MWVAATEQDVVFFAESLDVVIETVVPTYGLENLIFAYVTFDLWQ